MIPLLVGKSSADSWLVNSTCKLKAKQEVCCQSGSSHVETPGKVIQLEEARRSEEEDEKRELVRGMAVIVFATTLH